MSREKYCHRRSGLCCPGSLCEEVGSCKWEAGCRIAGRRPLAIQKAKVPKGAVQHALKNAINTEDQEQFRKKETKEEERTFIIQKSF